MHNDDCPMGICVFIQAVCDGGTDDGSSCDCVAGNCVVRTFEGNCCDSTNNCKDSPCIGTYKVCLDGVNQGYPCLRNAHCGGSLCGLSGKVCTGGDSDGLSCVTDNDCVRGTCTAAVAGPTPQPSTCVGDCNESGGVTIEELLALVNIALGNADVSACLPGDGNHDMRVTIDEIVAAANNALIGCTS